MTWADEYEFREPIVDLRDGGESAEALTEELIRELAPGHPLFGTNPHVIARSVANDDVVVVADRGVVALVHLTWTRRKAERPPWPGTQFMSTSTDFDAHFEVEYDEWED